MPHMLQNRLASTAMFEAAKPSTQPRVECVSVLEPDLDSLRILIVDDDENSAYLIERSLSERHPGRHIISISNEEAALEEIRERPFDIYLLDYQLRDGTCIEMLHRMSESQLIRTIVLTGMDEAQTSGAVLAAGAADFCRKDDVRSGLLERVIRYTAKRAQLFDEVHERERRLQQMLASTCDLFALINKHGHFTGMSRRTEADAVAINEVVQADRLIHPQDLSTFERALAEVLGAGATRSFEVRIDLGDGCFRFMRARLQNLLHDNITNAIVLSAHDITQEKADRKLKAFESQFSAILNNTIDDIWSIDRDYRLLSFNTAFANTMKRNGFEIYPGFSVLQPDLPALHRKFWQEMYDRALAGERFTLEKAAYFDPEIFYEMSFMPIYTDGVITGAAVQRKVITERKRAERELLSHRAYLQGLLNNTGDAIWSLDRDRKVVWMNEKLRTSVEQLYGKTVEVGTRPIPIVGELESKRWDEWFDAAFSGELVRTSYEIPAQGEVLSFDVRFNPVYVGNEIDGVVVVSREITEERRIEQQLIEQRDKAEQMNRLKSSFLANMSHEIRTPLTSIIGYADLLCAELTHREHIRYAEGIESSGRRLLTTINEILDLAKIESGAIELNIQRTCVDRCIENVALMLMPIARSKNLFLQTQNADSMLFAQIDPQLFERILVNVIGNALKFTKEGGVYVQLTANASTFAVRVSDTGIGIDPQFLPHIFDEFKQQSIGYNRKYEGSGLGLTITKRLLDLLRGSIEIVETGPQGTIFELTVPLYTDSSSRSLQSKDRAAA